MKHIRNLIAATALTFATGAMGATITVDWNTSVFEPAGISVGKVVHPGVDVSTSAGRFSGEVTASTGFDVAELFESPIDFFAYCYDLSQVLVNSATVYQVTYGASETMLEWLGAVNAVLGNGVHSWISSSNSSTVAAAIQLGIWEALHHGAGDTMFMLDSGFVSVNLSKVPDAVETQYAAFRTQMLDPNNTPLSPDFVMVLTSTASQDVITGRLSALVVPEPGTLALFACAVFAATFARRRRA